jgi:CheY-like chemotaxis protein
MSRVILIHWNAAEAQERAGRLRSAGHQPDTFTPQDAPALRALRESPPDAFVIDLSRLPSQGCAVATMLRQQKATRLVPIVFVGGDPQKVARVRGLLPDAVYTEWSRIAGALRKAIRNPPKDAVVPGIMAGYTASPLPKKLGIRPGSTVALLGAPAGFDKELDPPPENVRLQKHARGPAHLILLFAKSRADLDKRFPAALRSLAEGGGLWIIWPKQASKVPTDLTQNAVRAFGLAVGLVDYKICAIDQTWSGLLFTRRRGEGRGDALPYPTSSLARRSKARMYDRQ